MRQNILIIGVAFLILGLIVVVFSVSFVFETSFLPTSIDGLIIVFIGISMAMVSFAIPKNKFLNDKKNKTSNNCFASEILNIRFAKGEITKSQYEEIAKKINKDYIDFAVFSKSKYQNMIDFLLNIYRDQGFRYPEYQLQQRIHEKMTLGKSRVEAIEELNDKELRNFS